MLRGGVVGRGGVPLPKRAAGAALECFGRGTPPSSPHAPRHGEASDAECQFRPTQRPGRAPGPGACLKLGRFDRRRLGCGGWGGTDAGRAGVDAPSQNTQARLPPRVLGGGVDALPTNPYRGSLWVSVTTCWNVGRFWKGRAQFHAGRHRRPVLVEAGRLGVGGALAVAAAVELRRGDLQRLGRGCAAAPCGSVASSPCRSRRGCRRPSAVGRRGSRRSLET